MEPGWEGHLRGVLGYAAPTQTGPGRACRHALMAAHFGDRYPATCGDMCDLCRRRRHSLEAPDDTGNGDRGEIDSGGAAAETRDVTDAAIGMLHTLAQWPGSEKRATLTQLIDRARSQKARARRRAVLRAFASPAFLNIFFLSFL